MIYILLWAVVDSFKLLLVAVVRLCLAAKLGGCWEAAGSLSWLAGWLAAGRLLGSCWGVMGANV